jgi:hypothetical protein
MGMKKIIVTKDQYDLIRYSIKESHKSNNDMAKQQLFIIATMAYKMWEQLGDEDQLEDWMVSKIAQSEQSVSSVVKAYLYDEFTEGKDINTINFDELVIGKK